MLIYNNMETVKEFIKYYFEKQFDGLLHCPEAEAKFEVLDDLAVDGLKQIFNGNIEESYDDELLNFSAGVMYDVEYNDLENAKKYYEKSVEYVFRFACMYLHEDNEKATKYYEIAIEFGHTDSMVNLGVIYMHKKDYANTVKYYKMAVEHGITSELISIGYVYDHNLHDYENSVKYYLKSIEHGHKPYDYLANVYFKINDIENATKYYEMALEEGYKIMPYNYDNAGNKQELYNIVIKNKDKYDLHDICKYIESKMFVETNM